MPPPLSEIVNDHNELVRSTNFVVSRTTYLSMICDYRACVHLPAPHVYGVSPKFSFVGGYHYSVHVLPHGPRSGKLEHGSRIGGSNAQLGSCPSGAPFALFCC